MNNEIQAKQQLETCLNSPKIKYRSTDTKKKYCQIPLEQYIQSFRQNPLNNHMEPDIDFKTGKVINSFELFTEDNDLICDASELEECFKKHPKNREELCKKELEAFKSACSAKREEYFGENECVSCNSKIDELNEKT
eukprot:gb/GECH01012384.1/.p1 GENE.gb/GECH01012384.1/~~gb/GECH01012384.1/.p1  ORF type:complete len:137 (+),score=42.62 gb/GECH01012384.1/:1-411(+)